MKHVELLVGGVIGIIGGAALVKMMSSPTRPLTGPELGGDVLYRANFPMRAGARSDLVKGLQKALVRRGGIAAVIMQGAGQISGTLDAVTEKAIEAAGYSLPLSQQNYEKLVGQFAAQSAAQAAATKDYRQYIFVHHYAGTPVWKDVNSNGYQGMGKIADLQDGVFVGVPSGKATSRYIQALVQIESRIYPIWVEREKTVIVDSAGYTAKFRSGNGLQKDNSQLSAIVASF
jgi:hypothetical protein